MPTLLHRSHRLTRTRSATRSLTASWNRSRNWSAIARWQRPRRYCRPRTGRSRRSRSRANSSLCSRLAGTICNRSIWTRRALRTAWLARRRRGSYRHRSWRSRSWWCCWRSRFCNSRRSGGRRRSRHRRLRNRRSNRPRGGRNNRPCNRSSRGSWCRGRSCRCSNWSSRFRNRRCWRSWRRYWSSDRHRWFHDNARRGCHWRRRCAGRTHPRSFGSSFFRCSLRFCIRLGLSLSFGLSQKIFANFLRDVFGDRARVRLLFRDAIARQKINDRLGFDLEFAGQFVDAYLVCFAHACCRPFHGQKFTEPLFLRGFSPLTTSTLPRFSARLRNAQSQVPSS